MSPTLDVSGAWLGHYHQGGRRFPVSLVVAQVGNTFSGTMTDGVTVGELPYAQFAAHGHGRILPESSYRLWLLGIWGWMFRRHVPVTAAFALPETAAVEGMVRGRQVRFCKAYRGTARVEVRAGTRAKAIEVADHRVMYEGHADADGGTIEGRWTIPARPEFRTPEAGGEFVLRRAGS
jgi:hypothetical protein